MTTGLRTMVKKNDTITKLYRSTHFFTDAPVRDLFDAPKRKLIGIARPYTMLSWKELSQLYDAALALSKENVPGSVVELGVCNGGSAGITSALVDHDPTRHVWLFDSWEGLPEATADDVTCHGEKGEKGLCLGSEARVRELLFSKLRLDAGKIHLQKGWFDKTVPPVREHIGPIALLHIDCDWYESVKFCLEALYDQVVSGGFVFIDDYGYWQGCKKAVDEFVAARGLQLEMNRVDSTVMYFRK